jgi:preprotein translocase SecE subunit
LSDPSEQQLPGAAPGKEVGLLSRTAGFLRDVKQEMKLIQRPSWQEVRATTVVVLVFAFLFGFYLRALDWIFSPLQKWLLSH